MSAPEDGAGSVPGSPTAAASPFTREQTRVLEEAHQVAITRAVQEALAAARVDTTAKDAQIEELRREVQLLSRARPVREFGEKLGKPPNLEATGKNWEEFSFKFKSYMATQEERGVAALEAAEEPSTETIEYAELPEYMQALSRQVYYNLTMLSSGASLRIVRSVRSANGLEAYRLLSRRWNPSSKGRNLTKLSKVLHWDFGDATKMLDNLVAWESAVEDWENVTQEKLGDSVKCAIIAERAPAEVRTHLQLNAPNAKFPQMRAVVEEYLQANAGSATNPMEVDAIWGAKGKKGKGKGKGKKGKGKGGKGKEDKDKSKAGEKEEKFEGYCGKCGKWGHKQKVCRSSATVSEVTPQAPAQASSSSGQLAITCAAPPTSATPAAGARGAVLQEDQGWIFMVASADDDDDCDDTMHSVEIESAPESDGVISDSDWSASRAIGPLTMISERDLRRQLRRIDEANASRSSPSRPNALVLNLVDSEDETPEGDRVHGQRDDFLVTPGTGMDGLVNHIGAAQQCGRAGETVHIMIDSGSTETCCAPTHFPDYPLVASQTKALKTASGAALKHYGRKDVRFLSDEGEEITIRFSVHCARRDSPHHQRRQDGQRGHKCRAQRERELPRGTDARARGERQAEATSTPWARVTLRALLPEARRDGSRSGRQRRGGLLLPARGYGHRARRVAPREHRHADDRGRARRAGRRRRSHGQ